MILIFFQKICSDALTCCDYINEDFSPNVLRFNLRSYIQYYRNKILTNVDIYRFENFEFEISKLLKNHSFKINLENIKKKVYASNNSEKRSLEKSLEVKQVVERSKHIVDLELFYN